MSVLGRAGRETPVVSGVEARRALLRMLLAGWRAWRLGNLTGKTIMHAVPTMS